MSEKEVPDVGQATLLPDVPSTKDSGASGEAPAIVHSAREQWLLRRRELVTASDAAAILGLDHYRSPLSVYAEKRGLVETEETAIMRWGRGVEGAIANAYAEETGRETLDLGGNEIKIHPDLPWLGATLDRQTDGSEAFPAPLDRAPALAPAPLEIKAVSSLKKDQWVEDPPLQFQIQLQIQMACTSASWGSLCALLGGLSIAWKDILRHDEFLAGALPKLEEFWLRVKRGDPPEADAKPGTSDAVRALWPTDDGLAIALPQEAMALVEAWEDAKVLEKAGKVSIADAENKLRVLMCSATAGLLPDGTSLSLKTTERKGYTVEPTTYRTLRRFVPKGRIRG